LGDTTDADITDAVIPLTTLLSIFGDLQNMMTETYDPDIVRHIWNQEPWAPPVLLA